MSEFSVSIIIPVYNAVDFIRRAVESIVDQDFVSEVILIDDGAGDGALMICRELSNTHDKVKLYWHPGNENKGAGPSRNLGIEKATSPFIAFLDADDYCLQDRFLVTKQTFESDHKIDAVYEPIGIHFHAEEDKAKFCSWSGVSLEDADSHVTYPVLELAGFELFMGFLTGKTTFPSLDGLTVRKSTLDRVAPFRESLRLHQDTDLLIRLAYASYMHPGRRGHIVANRYVHNENRISGLNFESRFLQMQELKTWSKNAVNEEEAIKAINRMHWLAKLRFIFKTDGFIVKFLYKLTRVFL